MRSLETHSARTTRKSALDEWYESVRDHAICDLSIADLARSCRQALFPDYLVPVAVQRLKSDPLAGALYHGELLASLRHVDREFWGRSGDLVADLAGVLQNIPTDELSAEVDADIAAIRESAGLGSGGQT
jgi:hypothetical protein